MRPPQFAKSDTKNGVLTHYPTYATYVGGPYKQRQPVDKQLSGQSRHHYHPYHNNNNIEKLSNNNRSSSRQQHRRQRYEDDDDYNDDDDDDDDEKEEQEEEEEEEEEEVSEKEKKHNNHNPYLANPYETQFVKKCSAFFQAINMLVTPDVDPTGEHMERIQRFFQLIGKLSVLKEWGVPYGQNKLGSGGFRDIDMAGAIRNAGKTFGSRDVSVRMFRHLSKAPKKRNQPGRAAEMLQLQSIAGMSLLVDDDNVKDNDGETEGGGGSGGGIFGWLKGLFNSSGGSSAQEGEGDAPPIQYQRLSHTEYCMNIDVKVYTAELLQLSDRIVASSVFDIACEANELMIEKYVENLYNIVNTVSLWSV
jgi:hypothetical protein